jgi:hypothetical protein
MFDFNATAVYVAKFTLIFLSAAKTALKHAINVAF